jgi:hypothetical protein
MSYLKAAHCLNKYRKTVGKLNKKINMEHGIFVPKQDSYPIRMTQILFEHFGFDVRSEEVMKYTIFWGVMPYSSLESYVHFGEIY